MEINQPSLEEFQEAKALVRQIEQMEQLGVKIGTAWIAAKLDAEIVIMTRRLMLKIQERESMN